MTETPNGPTEPTAPIATAEPEPTGRRVTGDQVRDLTRLRRSSTDKHVAGVAGGLARHLDIDPVLLRVAFVVFAFFSGASLLVYGAIWLFVPRDDATEAPINIEPRTRSYVLFAVGLVAALLTIGDLLGGDDSFWLPIPLLIIGLIVWLIIRKRDRSNDDVAETSDASFSSRPAPTRDPRKRGPVLVWFVLPLIALAWGFLGTFDVAGASIAGPAYPAVALAIVALALIVGSMWGRAGSLILLGVILAFATLVATAGHKLTMSHWDAGDRTAAPTSANELENEYWLGAGEHVVDLSKLEDPTVLAGRDIEIGTGMGQLEVIVPKGINIHIDANAGAGSITIFDQQPEEGLGVDHTARQTSDNSRPELQLELFVGAGEIIVRNP